MMNDIGVVWSSGRTIYIAISVFYSSVEQEHGKPKEKELDSKTHSIRHRQRQYRIWLKVPSSYDYEASYSTSVQTLRSPLLGHLVWTSHWKLVFLPRRT